MAHGLFAAACRLLSSCGTWALENAGSVVVARRLSSCGKWAPEQAGSIVAARGLSCPAARGILVPRPGIELSSPALEGGFLTLDHQGRPSF